MTSHTEYRPLLVVVPHDFGPPIYYSPPEDETLLFSQTLSAILLGIKDLDQSQIKVGLESIKYFFDTYEDRRKLYSGGGALLILPTPYKDRVGYLKKLKDFFNSMKIDLKIKFWDEFKMDFTIALFALDLSLRTDLGIVNFIMNNLDEVKKWDIKAHEYKHTGLIFIHAGEASHTTKAEGQTS